MALFLAGVLGFATLGSSAAEPVADEQNEVIHYRWKMLGVAGLVARLLFPARGHGVLSTRREGAGRLASELRIASRGAGADEFWAYGSTIDPRVPEVLVAWNASRFRGRDKRKETDLAGSAVIDIPSSIYLLRTHPPRAPKKMRIWSDGKIYPVTLIPGGRVSRRIGGTRRTLQHFSIEGRREPGERRWKGHLEVWLTLDEAAVPVEILFASRRGRVRLSQLETPPG